MAHRGGLRLSTGTRPYGACRSTLCCLAVLSICVESSTALGGFRVLKKTSEAPYTTKVNYRVRTSRGTTQEENQGLNCCGGGAACPSSCPPLAASARASHAALSSLARLAHTRRTHTCLPACLAGWLATRYARNTRTVTRVTFWIRVRPAYRMHRMHTHVP